MNAAWSLKPRVRHGHQGDKKAVSEILESALREHGFTHTEGDVNWEIETFGSGGPASRDEFVVVSGGKVLGFLVLIEASPGCGEISKVFVARSHRTQGLGTMLIDACIQRAKERGYREIILETHTAFRDARRYYERHGWTLIPHFENARPRMYVMRLIGAPRSIMPVTTSQTRLRIPSEHRVRTESGAPSSAPQPRPSRAQGSSPKSE